MCTGEPGGSEAVYSDYAGLRFPSLDTAENYDYNRDRGFDRIVERAFPIKAQGPQGPQGPQGLLF